MWQEKTLQTLIEDAMRLIMKQCESLLEGEPTVSK